MSEEVMVQDDEKWVPESAFLKGSLKSADAGNDDWRFCDWYLQQWGGQELAKELNQRGIVAKQHAAIAALAKSIGFARMGEWEQALNCAGDVVLLLQMIDVAPELDQELFQRFAQPIDDVVVALALGIPINLIDSYLDGH